LHAFGAITQVKERSTVPVASCACMCYRVDDLVALAGVPFPTHVKIDVDGYELAVLEGSRSVLGDPRLRGLQVEVMEFETGGKRRDEVVAMLRTAGYTLDRVIPHRSDMVLDLQFSRP
jgi:hypothetical protein